MLTIAHRLNTVTGENQNQLPTYCPTNCETSGGDTVLVLDKGKLAEQVKQKIIFFFLNTLQITHDINFHHYKQSLSSYWLTGFTRVPAGRPQLTVPWDGQGRRHPWESSSSWWLIDCLIDWLIDWLLIMMFVIVSYYCVLQIHSLKMIDSWLINYLLMIFIAILIISRASGCHINS